MNSPPVGKRIALAACVSAVALAAPLGAAIVRQSNLLDLRRGAGTIVHGRVIERTEIADARPVPCIEYRLRVLEAVKGAREASGEPMKEIRFRHAADRPGRVRADGLEEVPLRLGVPEYRVGEELVLFLTRESSVKLCAPVALEQGAFRVKREGGKAFAANGAANRHVFAGVEDSAFQGLAPEELPSALKEKGPLELKCLLRLCRGAKE